MSPDGRSLTFLSNRGGTTEVYVMAAHGTGAKQLTTRKSGVDSFCWSPDGRSIAYLAQDDDAPGDDKDPIVADSGNDFDRLWLLDLASGKERKLGVAGCELTNSPARTRDMSQSLPLRRRNSTSSPTRFTASPFRTGRCKNRAAATAFRNAGCLAGWNILRSACNDG